MSDLKLASLGAAALAAGLSACASSPQREAGAPLDPYDYLAFDRLSRIEITQMLDFDRRTLAAEVLLANTGATAEAEAHEHAARRAPAAGERLRNKTRAGGDGRSYYVQAQNSLDAPGWVSDDNRLRHIDSGLLCPSAITLEETDRAYALERVIEFGDQGLDVACHYVADGAADIMTVYASYWPDVSLEEHAAAAVESIAQSFAVSSIVNVPVVELTTEETDTQFGQLIAGLEEPIAGGFEIGQEEGVSYRTSLWLVETHGWHVKVRSTYPSADEVSELLSAIQFMASHLAVRAKNMAEPMASGAEV